MRVALLLLCLAPLGAWGCTSETPDASAIAGTNAGFSGAGAGGVAAGAGGGSGSPSGGAPAAAGGGAGGTSAGSAGTSANAAGSSGAGGSATTPSGTPIFVAVGYSGRCIRSVDLGVTWIDEQTLGGGGDDEFLLRAVGFGGGVFVAVGWKILSSPDGKTWTEQQNPQQQWLGGIQFDAGLFVATGGFGYSARSSDGKAWSAAQSIPNNEASRSLAVGGGKFVTATDPGNWFESSDALIWTLNSGGHQSTQVAYCDGDFQEYDACSGAFNARGRATAGGITIRLDDGKLQRAINGQDFSPVLDSPSGLEDVAVGHIE